MLKAIVTKSELAKLPEAIGGLYVPVPGSKSKYLLAVEPVDGHELGDFSVLQAEADKLSAALEKHLLGSVDEAVTAAGGNAALLKPMVASRARLDRSTLGVTITNEDGTPYYNNKGLPGTIDDLVADLKKHPALSRAFDDVSAPETPPVGEGPSRPPEWGASRNLTEYMVAERARRSATKTKDADAIRTNPWAKGSFNLTEQSKIMKADPNRAARLRDDALRGAA